jgi:putative membrane protein
LTNVVHAHLRVGHVRSTNAILPVALLASLAAILLWSAVRPHDYFTWFLEVAPVLIAVPTLVATRRGFRFTALAYVLMWLHAVVLVVGGHYTYAEVPPGHWVRDAFDLSRNHYDRVGHFMQGFVPAIVAREVLVRRSPLEPGKWLFFLVTCVCLAISAGYELVEFAVAVGTGEAAEAFLGTQGDVWDTQIDMLLALVGAVAAQLLLGRTHDRQLARRD